MIGFNLLQYANIINLLATTVVAFATIILAIITFWYARITRNILAEQQKARVEEVMPKIWARLDFVGPNYLTLRIENVGRGPAIATDFSFKIEPDGGKQEWHHPLLSPKDYYRFFLPVPKGERISQIFLQKYKKITFYYKCSDLFGNQYSENGEIDLEKFQKGLHAVSGEASVLWEQSLVDYVKEIREEIKKIAENLSHS